MSSKKPITRENLNDCLKELGKEFRKLNGTRMPAEIILVGGAAILANYGFREMTYDIDAVIVASTAMKEAINHVGDRLGLPNGWLNTDFRNTKSYSNKLSQVSGYYKTFSNILTIRTVSAEYLIAMKLMSGRQYKNDLSDIIGIMWEHQKNGIPISRKSIEKAIVMLYGEDAKIPAVSQKTLDNGFADGNLERAFLAIRETEKQSHDILLDFDKAYHGEMNGENIDTILERARQKRQKDDIDHNER